MQNDIDQVLIHRADIARRVEALAKQIAEDLALASASTSSDEHDHAGRITLVPILTGSLVFVADLIRCLPVRMQVKVISISSYPGPSTTSQGPTILGGLDTLPKRLDGANVLLIDDILDTGRTLAMVIDHLKAKKPRSIHTCVMLRKQRPEEARFNADYVGFDIPNRFVVGYGLDYNGYYRNLPDIVTLRAEAIHQRRHAEAV